MALGYTMEVNCSNAQSGNKIMNEVLAQLSISQSFVEAPWKACSNS